MICVQLFSNLLGTFASSFKEQKKKKSTILYANGKKLIF